MCSSCELHVIREIRSILQKAPRLARSGVQREVSERIPIEVSERIPIEVSVRITMRAAVILAVCLATASGIFNLSRTDRRKFTLSHTMLEG